ncbi:MAG: glutaredoxin family protein [Desulfarculaceae bacterium]|nr:glutaredoxin family protein [Desulfarculaceae bacterium]
MGATRAVTIFKTPACGRCRAAKEFFAARGFAVEEVDVTASISAKRRMARLAPGARVVPVIAFEEEIEVGWRPDYWKKRLGEST